MYVANNKMKKEDSLVFQGLTLHSPLISVILFSRQYGDTLRIRLDRILNQYTTFNTEVIIIDRGLNEEVRDICQEYKALYPGRVRFYTRIPGNLLEKSQVVQLKGTLGIICRDNDLWSNVFKLQKQGAFLMTHPEYNLCFHNVKGSYASYLQSRDYQPGEIPSEKLFKYYSPLFRLPNHRSAYHFLLYEKIGENIFAEYLVRERCVVWMMYILKRYLINIFEGRR